MRELSFPLHALGSDENTHIDLSDLAAWIAGIRGSEVDIVSYQTDMLLKSQIPHATIPAAGGTYYAKRLFDAFGVTDTTLTNAPELNLSSIGQDIELIRKSAKICRFALPSPGALSLIDEYYHDTEEVMEAVTDSYTQLGRFMRDNGITGCVILGDTPTEMELEKMHGTKYLWSTSADAFESVLEYSRDIVIPEPYISRLCELIDSYAIRNVYLKDATPQALGSALDTVDSDHLYLAGYASQTAQENYWERLAEIKIQKTDLDI